MKNRQQDRIYSPEECQEMIRKMRIVSNGFYGAATQTGCHAFIEFCGLMNEFIQICERAVAEGTDFNTCNTHTGQALPVQPHNIAYLAEKLNCIYGPALAADPELAKRFCELITERTVTIHADDEVGGEGRAKKAG